MKIQNIYNKKINVEGKSLKVNKQRKVEHETQEIKNLVKQKYIKLIK